jgi:Zn-finger protein
MEPKDSVSTNYFKGFTNLNCEFYPCHKIKKPDFNCLFCYCPLVYLECPGPYKVFIDSNGDFRKDCSQCILPHNGIETSWRFIQTWLKKKYCPWKPKLD